MGKIKVRLKYELDVEIRDDVMDLSGMAEAVLDQGEINLSKSDVEIRVVKVCADESCERGIGVKLENEIGLRLGYLKIVQKQYIVKVAENFKVETIKQKLKDHDSKCKFDEEGNPSLFWVLTSLFANEIEAIEGVFCALESKGGRF